MTSIYRNIRLHSTIAEAHVVASPPRTHSDIHPHTHTPNLTHLPCAFRWRRRVAVALPLLLPTATGATDSNDPEVDDGISSRGGCCWSKPAAPNGADAADSDAAAVTAATAAAWRSCSCGDQLLMLLLLPPVVCSCCCCTVPVLSTPNSCWAVFEMSGGGSAALAAID